MALEMRNLAKGQGLASLRGLLEVAYYEAFSTAIEIQIPLQLIDDDQHDF
jgi:hypothetical protein